MIKKMQYICCFIISISFLAILSANTVNAEYTDMPVTGTNTVDLIIHATDNFAGIRYAYVRNEGKWDIENSTKAFNTTDSTYGVLKNYQGKQDVYLYEDWKITDVQGAHVVCVALQDRADSKPGTGNRSDTATGYCSQIYLDKEAPKNAKITINDGNPWINKDTVKVKIEVTDNWAGIGTITYSDKLGSIKETSLDTKNKMTCERDNETGTQKCTIEDTITVNSDTPNGHAELQFTFNDTVGNKSTVGPHNLYFDKGVPSGTIKIYSDGSSGILGNKVSFGFEVKDLNENKLKRKVSGIQKILVKSAGTDDSKGKTIYETDSVNDPMSNSYTNLDTGQIIRQGLNSVDDKLEFSFDTSVEVDNNKQFNFILVVIDRAGNRKEIESENIIVNWLKLTSFTLTNVVNPSVYSSADANYNNFAQIGWSKPTSNWSDLNEMGYLGSNLFNKNGELQQFLLGTNFDYELRWEWTGNKNANITVEYNAYFVNTSSGTCNTAAGCIKRFQNGTFSVKGGTNQKAYFIEDNTGRFIGYNVKINIPDHDKFKADYSEFSYDENTKIYVDSKITISATETLAGTNQTISKTEVGRFPVLRNDNTYATKAYLGYINGDIEDFLWFNEEN